MVSRTVSQTWTSTKKWSLKKNIFKKGSRTYYYSSIFFPKNIREDVTTLYAYVRTVDDLVDTIPQQKDEFYTYKKETTLAWKGTPSQNPIIDDFIALAKRCGITKQDIDAFLHAMELDLKQNKYDTQKAVLKYIYGSAEVVGLMMNRVMGIPKKVDTQARLLGRSMQYINFIRDIGLDLKTLHRTYIPQSELKKYHFKNLSFPETSKHPENFKQLIREQILTYREWRTQAHKGIHALPRFCQLPVLTADAMYNWTAEKIYKDPFIVYRKVVKPGKLRILKTFIGFALRQQRRTK